MRYTKQQLIKFMDDSVPLLIIHPNDPNAYQVARIIKDIYVMSGKFEEAAYARGAEVQFEKYHSDQLTPAQKRASRKSARELKKMLKELDTLMTEIEANIPKKDDNGPDQ